MFKKIGSEHTLTKKIEIQLENAIREKKLKPDQKLPSQEELCNSFGVGRNILREAIRSLASRGLIRVRKGSGMYVADFSMQDAVSSMNYFLELHSDQDGLYQIIKLRQMFEPQIVESTCRNIKEPVLKQLRETIVELKNCPLDDLEREAEIDNHFHSLIAEGSGNFAVSLIMQPIYAIMPKFHKEIFGKMHGLKSKTLKYHRLIFEAIEKHDDKGAKRLMQSHLAQTERNFLRYFRK